MRLVVKVGSAVLSDASGALDQGAVARLARDVADLHRASHGVILVSSGAVAAGLGRLSLTGKSADLQLKQAAAAVGQVALMQAYDACFQKEGITPAQILLTREDLMSRGRYLNVRNTFQRLLALRALPIVNENDSVSTAEIQFGDNDTLSALVAMKVEADRLILLSNVDGYCEMEADGTLSGRVVPEVARITREMERSASTARGFFLASGGMAAKMRAARMATAAGVETWIGSGRAGGVLARILKGESGAGTRFLARATGFDSRHAWIAFGRAPKGVIVVDDGAREALLLQKRSLLPTGVRAVRGGFAPGDTVSVRAPKVGEIARGLVNFSAEDLRRIRGRHSREIPALLGRAAAAEVIHRDNLVVL